MPERQRPPARDQIAEARSTATETGRVNQKLRTRQALVEAARQLVAAGRTPTLAEVADHALISKTTAYRYFASADALIEEVFFDRAFPTADDVLRAVGDDPTARVLAVEAAVNDVMLSHERAMRVIVRNALDTALSSDDGTPTRLGRRQGLIAAAVEPLRATLDPAVVERLERALALAIGPEAVITARDICGLDAAGTRELTRWVVTALVARALEGGEGRPS